MGQEKAEKPHCPYQVGRDLQRAGAEAVHERTLQGDGSQAHSFGDRECQADQGEREADNLMTVEHGEWVVKTGAQGIDENGRDIPLLTGPEMRQSALEGMEQLPDVFAGAEPLHERRLLCLGNV